MHTEITVNIDREKLLVTLRENKEKHQKAYEDVLNGWREAVKKAAQEILKTIGTDDEPKSLDLITKHGQRPRNYVSEYDSVIHMLEMSGDETIGLTQEDFNTFVRDEWNWKANWSSTSSSYSTTSSTAT